MLGSFRERRELERQRDAGFLLEKERQERYDKLYEKEKERDRERDGQAPLKETERERKERDASPCEREEKERDAGILNETLRYILSSFERERLRDRDREMLGSF
ncbi:Nucleosome-Remodeling Factor Subunit Bptf [Manis pentadactyla]|nr:Nucleosome-Remodeling Factor Subunit Bptf [Manis pentadactyla]